MGTEGTVFSVFLFMFFAALAALLLRIVTYFVNRHFITQALLYVGCITLLLGLIMFVFEYLRPSVVSSFVILATAVICGIGTGAIIGTSRTLKRDK